MSKVGASLLFLNLSPRSDHSRFSLCPQHISVLWSTKPMIHRTLVAMGVQAFGQFTCVPFYLCPSIISLTNLPFHSEESTVRRPSSSYRGFR
jgi:hypothetical protein